jgi:hypothetical protein
MNLYYKILMMAFLAGATGAVSGLVLAREMFCLGRADEATYAAIAVSVAGGAIISSFFKKLFGKSPASAMNMVISFSAIAGAFVSMAGLFFIRYFKVMIHTGPAHPLALYLLAPIIYLPWSALFYLQANAGRSLASNEKSGNPGFVLLVFAAGIMSGAVIHFLFLWRYFTNIDILYMSGILVLAATYIFFRDKTMEGRYTMLAVIVSVTIYLAFSMTGLKEKADRASSRAVYEYAKGLVVAEKEFPTEKFVMEKLDELCVYENGALTYVIGDEKYVEMAKLARGKNLIIINGGAAGLVEALEKNKASYSIISYEADPYASYILESLFKSGAGAKSRAVFKAGDIAKDEDLVKSGFRADTVFINARHTGRDPYSKANLQALKESFMAPGGKLVADDGGEKARVEAAIKGVFGNSAVENGFITAVKTDEK